MIELVDKHACCGCSACVQKCPRQCILIVEDEEGFLYPVVNKEDCIDCGLCEKVCPVIHQSEERKPLKTYAAKNKDEDIRMLSSSGGFFTLLAEEVIKEGGVVFGAKFDDSWEVKHDYTETIGGLHVFRSSKYVQSRIEDNYKKAESFLKSGRRVLFSGTPCQIAGLKRFLRKEYDNLLTVDFVCHGVPSPGVWRRYLTETVAHLCDKNSVPSDPISKGNTHIESVSFRNKCSGWKKYSFALTLSATTRSGAKNTVSLVDVFSKNTFMKGFLANLYLRPSCYTCPAKCGKSGSDITIGDLWGAPSIIGQDDDDRGTSLVLINREVPLFRESASLWIRDIEYRLAFANNYCIERSVKEPKKRKQFYLLYTKRKYSLETIISRLTKVSFYDKCITLIKRILKRIIKRR